jgi:hypothetical protein
MAAVTPGQARDFYRAAAGFYRQVPWRSVGPDEPIKVECEQVEGGPRFAVVLGKQAKIKGLWLCDDWKSCFLFEQGRYPEIAEHLQYTALHFGPRSQIGPKDLEMAQRLSFEVASSRAYPAAIRKERGADFRGPDAGDLEVLEACLWVIPDFLRRAEDRKPDVYEYAFKGREGKTTLDLSWVPRERLERDPPGTPH